MTSRARSELFDLARCCFPVAVAVDEAELWAMRGMAVTLAVVAATLAALLVKKTM